MCIWFGEKYQIIYFYNEDYHNMSFESLDKSEIVIDKITSNDSFISVYVTEKCQKIIIYQDNEKKKEISRPFSDVN